MQLYCDGEANPVEFPSSLSFIHYKGADTCVGKQCQLYMMLPSIVPAAQRFLPCKAATL